MIENNLPKGWTICKLGEVCSKPQYGWTSIAGNSGKIKYLRTTDISGGKLNWDTVPYCVELPSEIGKYQVRKNDILVSRAGSVGYNFRIKEDVPFDAVFASYLIRFKAFNEITARYIDHFFKSEEYWNQISDFSAGIAIPNVNATKLEALNIPLPPLPEQRRIVTRLDALMEKVERNKQRLNKIPALLKRFRQSVLAAAVSGRLTEDWREKNKNVESITVLLQRINQERLRKYETACLEAKKEGRRKLTRPSNLDNSLIIEQEVEALTLDIPLNWVKIPLAICTANYPNSIVDGPFGSSIVVKTDYIESGVPVVRINNVRPLQYINDNLKYVSTEKFIKLERHKISSGDILLAKVGATIGDCCIYPENLPIAMLSTTGSCRITVDLKYFDNKYICYVLNSLKGVMQQIASEVAQPFLNMSTVKNLPVPFCSLKEQQEIVRRVEHLFAFADKVEARYTKAKAVLDKLPQSILAKAFRGELVPQNPEDEPANLLLERIKAEKAKIARQKNGKKTKIYSVEKMPVMIAAEGKTKYKKNKNK